ncbi:hypothetical protein NCS52_01588700 [Fusarium sp. LHS14.1]|nr:hypothetical protein NCS52_01588700 [Fusarium sp. LHS14.1]
MPRAKRPTKPRDPGVGKCNALLVVYGLGKDETLEDVLNILDKFAGKEDYAYLAGCKERYGRVVVDIVLYYPCRRRVAQWSNQRKWKRKGAKGDVLMVRPQPCQQHAVKYFHECEERLEEEYPKGFSASAATVEEVAKAYLDGEKERRALMVEKRKRELESRWMLRKQAALAAEFLPRDLK